MLRIVHRIVDHQATRREIARLALGLLALVLAGAAALVAYAWIAVNEREATHEEALASRALSRIEDGLRREMISGAVWTEAFEKTAVRPDPRWIRSNLAHYFALTFGHDVTLIVGADGELMAAEAGDAPTHARAARRLMDALKPWVDDVQIREFAGRQRREGGASVDNAVTRIGPINLDGAVYLLAASTVVPIDGTPRDFGRVPVIISGRRIDPGFLAGLKSDLNVAGLALRTDGPRTGEISASLEPGDPKAPVLAWMPDRPGGAVLAHAQVWIIGGLVVVIALAALLGLRIRSLFAGLARKDRDLASTMRDLVVARDLAEAASNAKTEFIANMSHEVRTPLNGVLGMAQALERESLSPAQQHKIRVIRSSGRALLHILDDVLDIAKIEAGHLEIREGDFDLEVLLADVCAIYDANAMGKGVRLRWRNDAALVWRGDVDRIRQILLNLVSNAIKFTDAGEIDVAVVQAADGAVRFTVRDEGVGLSEAELGRVFEKFHQTESAVSRKAGGTGLGLALSRSLALAMGGDLDVESELGVGSTFTLTLPLVPGEPEDGDATDAGNETVGPRLSLLAAEDNPTNQLVLQAVLEPFEIDLHMVANGQEAVEAWRAQRFDAILMDIQMPVMNGMAATDTIRRAEVALGRARIPILALTANAMAEQRATYLAGGFDAVVAKPLDVGGLLDALQIALRNRTDDAAAAA